MNNLSESKRIPSGILIGIVLLLLTGGATALAVFMVSILVFGCVQSPPDWLYTFMFAGFPLPLIITSVIVPYLYIKKQKTVRIILTIGSGVFLSCMIFLIWFLILTKYC